MYCSIFFHKKEEIKNERIRKSNGTIREGKYQN